MFHILSVGWGAPLIRTILDRVQAQTPFQFSHLLLTANDRDQLLASGPRAGVHCLREQLSETLPDPDEALLASVEGPGVPTVHNMIMSDRVVRTLDYRDALAYATLLTERLGAAYRQIRPSIVLGGFDSLHGSLALAVAKRDGIPWFAMNFTTLPHGFSAFATEMTPGANVVLNEPDAAGLRQVAERTVDDFVSRAHVVPAYHSANSTALVLKRLPRHLRSLAGAVRRVLARRFDSFTEYSTGRLMRQYLRKRLNLYRLPTSWFAAGPPAGPFVFFGFHMQPETSIDVWAPFYADQFHLIETIARSTPPTHRVVVKVHRSDADNYSRGDLDRLRRLPGVVLASPFAQSRDFLERASLVFSIQGTIGVEAALLGRPVLTFGESALKAFPTVTRVGALHDLPAQVRAKLAEPAPSRDEIVQGLVGYLRAFAPGCYNDWEAVPTDAEIQQLADQFTALSKFVDAKSGTPG